MCKNLHFDYTNTFIWLIWARRAAELRQGRSERNCQPKRFLQWKAKERLIPRIQRGQRDWRYRAIARVVMARASRATAYNNRFKERSCIRNPPKEKKGCMYIWYSCRILFCRGSVAPWILA